MQQKKMNCSNCPNERSCFIIAYPNHRKRAACPILADSKAYAFNPLICPIENTRVKNSPVNVRVLVESEDFIYPSLN